MLEEIFWWENPRFLITKDNWKVFIPRIGMDRTTYYNSFARFTIYLGILFYIFYQKPRIIILVLLGLILTVILYNYDKNKSIGKLGDKKDDSISSIDGVPCSDALVPASYGAYGRVNPQLLNSTQIGGGKTQGDFDESLLVGLPSELFDKNQGKNMGLKAHNDDGKNCSVETNGLPYDNQMQAPRVPNFDLRPDSSTTDNTLMAAAAVSQLINNKIEEGNFLASQPAPMELTDAFKMGDRMGDNINRNPDIHSMKVKIENGASLCGTPKGLAYQPQKCTQSTPNNPFSNVLVTDVVKSPTRGPACMDRNLQDNNWSTNLYRNINDVWDRNNGQMSYNTQNSTTIPNDRDAYQKWLYHTPYVCKDGDMEACYGIEEMQTRVHGQILSR